MGERTEISWTDHTFNPWWGCTNVSPGCDHCYAEAFSKRTGHDVWGDEGDRRRFGDKHWAEPLKWDRLADRNGVRARVFCASMADVFEDRDDHLSDRARLFELIARTPNLDWQLLTKRPENVIRLVPSYWLYHSGFPENVWIGTTVEDQDRAEERIPELLTIPARVRFLSCEPLLETVDVRPWLRRISDEAAEASVHEWDVSHRIGWVIVGGESGPHHRPLNLDHARSLRDECQRWNVPFFFKQIGGRTPTAGGRLLDGREWHEFPRAHAG